MMLLRCLCCRFCCCCRVCVVCRDRTQTGQTPSYHLTFLARRTASGASGSLFHFGSCSLTNAFEWPSACVCECVCVFVGHVFLIGAIIIYYCCCHCHCCWAGEQVLIVRVEFFFGSPSLSSFTRSVSFKLLYLTFWGTATCYLKVNWVAGGFSRASSAWKWVHGKKGTTPGLR